MRLRYFFILLFVVFLVFPFGVDAACDEVLPSVPKSQPVPSQNPLPQQPMVPKMPVVYNHSLMISEVFPDPIGDDAANEFIELYNYSQQDIDIAGWKFAEVSGKVFTLPTNVSSSVPSREYFALYRSASGLVLNNNGGDQIALFDPNGDLVDSMQYTGTAVEGKSLSLDADGEWKWTSKVTPGTVNLFDTDPADDKDDIEKPKTDPQPDEKEKGDDVPVPDDKDSDEKNPNNEKPTAPDKEVPPKDDEDEQTEPPADNEGDKPTPEDTQARLFINEVFPNPPGSDFPNEWIELRNSEDRLVNLVGWKIADSVRTHEFSMDAEIPARGYLFLKQPELPIALNNTGDTVMLVNPLGEVVDIMSFPADGAEGSSWARDTVGKWQWNTQPTPGQENIFPSVEESPQQEVDAGAQEIFDAQPSPSSVAPVSEGGLADQEKESIQESHISIADVKQLPLGSKVEIIGSVTVLPSTFHSDFFYIADESAGIQVSFSQGIWPEMKEGSVVRITGELSEAHSEKKVNIASIENVVVLDTEPQLVTPRSVAAFAETEEGSLIQIQGIVAERSRYQLILDDQWVITIKQKTQIDTSRFQQGDRMMITGILTQQKEEYQLWPRYQPDLVQENAQAQVLGTSQSLTLADESLGASDQSSRDSTTIFQRLPMLFPSDAASARYLMFASFFIGLVGAVLLGGYYLEKRWKFFSKRKGMFLKH